VRIAMAGSRLDVEVMKVPADDSGDNFYFIS